MAVTSNKLPHWTIAAPLLAWVVLVAGTVTTRPGWLIALMAVARWPVLFAAVHHAEVVAHKVGEPFGTLVLAIAVTVIEVALIVSVMLSSGPRSAWSARDTVFAAVMTTRTASSACACSWWAACAIASRPSRRRARMRPWRCWPRW